MTDRNALSASVRQASSNDRPQYFTRNSSRCRGHHDTGLVSCTHRRHRSQRFSYFSVALKANAPLVPRSTRVPPVEPLSFSIKQSQQSPDISGSRLRGATETAAPRAVVVPCSSCVSQLSAAAVEDTAREKREKRNGGQTESTVFFFYLPRIKAVVTYFFKDASDLYTAEKSERNKYNG